MKKKFILNNIFNFISKLLLLIINIFILYYNNYFLHLYNFSDNFNFRLKTNFTKTKKTFIIKNNFHKIYDFKNDSNLKSNNTINVNKKFPVTIISSLYKIKSKISFDFYLKWVKEFFKISTPMVFFIDPKITSLVKPLRDEKYFNRTIWIEKKLEEFYMYKYYENFKKTYEIDIEKWIHSPDLYLLWAEKINMVKMAIQKNYFNSDCFYWIDAGYLRNGFEEKLLNWPKPFHCYKDDRIHFLSIRNLTIEEIKNFKTLKINHHFFRNVNVGGGFFGGKPEKILIFFNLYEKALNEWYKNKLFIGKEQNLFAYIIYLNPNVTKLIYRENSTDVWFYPKHYFSLI